MKEFYWEHDRNYFKVPFEVIEKKVSAICQEYGIKSSPEEMTNGGMKELFDQNGNLLEDYAKEKLEYGKKAGMFGDAYLESVWASHLGD